MWRSLMDKVLEYWEKMAKEVLPFLVGRRIAIEQKFGNTTMYHRHPKGEKNKWIYIDEVAEVVEWADKHAWSFHPHVRGQKNWWFVIDVDGRGESFNIEIIKKVASVLAQLFDQHGIRYLVKYSGNRGFHFMWEWDMSGFVLKGKERWKLAKDLVLRIRQRLEQELQKDIKLAAKLSKIVGSGCPFTLTNSQETECTDAVLLDANILHVNANIRSPFSPHPKTGLVSMPLKGLDRLDKFEKSEAEQDNVVGQDWSWVKMPRNKWTTVSKVFK